MTKSKTFIQALNLLSEDVEESKKFLSDKRLTQVEKTILNGWLLLRDGKFEEVLKELPKVPSSYDEVVDSQKNLLIGVAFNNKSECYNGLPYLKKAVGQIAHTDLVNLKFSALKNLFITYLNLKDVKGMEEALNQLQALPLKKEAHELIVLRLQFIFCSYTSQNQLAESLLLKLNSLSEKMPEGDRVGFIINKFDHYLKTERYTLCEASLSELKHLKKYHFGANFKFMRKLLDHFVQQAPIYFYERDFAGHPILILQMQVLSYLEQGQRQEAVRAWDELKKGNAQTYLPNFVYQGDKCLFSLCLEKLMASPAKKVELESLDKGKTKEQILIQLLQSGALLNKEELYMQLWGVAPNSKDDLANLGRMVSRIRSKHGLNITTKKGCFLLKPEKKIS